MSDDIQVAFDALLSQSIQVLATDLVGGGCVSDAYRVVVRGETDELEVLFAKRNDASFLDNFRCEAEGLDHLSQTGTIQVPRLVAIGEFGGKSWLIMQWIEQGSRPEGFFRDFGKQLAALHRGTVGKEIGWHQDNYLGAARQLNVVSATADQHDWPEFFSHQRIGFQIQWARQQSLVDLALTNACEQIMNRMDELLAGRDETTSLLHGDLWSGNYLCGADGQSVIIDPAVYRGCREAEFGMLKLYGACPPAFYDAYQRSWPLPDGWQRRVDVYELYHLLNHLNLFGGGYLQQCNLLAAEILSRR